MIQWKSERSIRIMAEEPLCPTRRKRSSVEITDVSTAEDRMPDINLGTALPSLRIRETGLFREASSR
jgi:hypothetical protein